MARFLFISAPVDGHSMTPLPIMQRLVADGHDVDWLAGRQYARHAEDLGVRHRPFRHGVDPAGRDIFDVWPELRAQSGLKLLKTAFRDFFIPEGVQQVRDIAAVASDATPDVIVSSGPLFGPAMARELFGLPLATLGDGPLAVSSPDVPPFGPGLQPWRGPVGRLRHRALHAVTRRVFADVDAALGRARAEVGLPAHHPWVFDAFVDSDLHLQGCVPGFEYPLRTVPAHVRWVGALRPLPDAGWEPLVWWDELDGRRPVVHVTQGTIRPDLDELIRPAIRALQHEDVLVVVTTGAADPAELGPLPANVRAARYVPYERLLAKASVFVTNGGYIGTNLALHHGAAVVQVGNTEEKAEIGARVRYSGVGRAFKRLPGPGVLRLAVHQCLSDSAIRANVERLAADYRRHDARDEAAELLGELALRRRMSANQPTPA